MSLGGVGLFVCLSVCMLWVCPAVFGTLFVWFRDASGGDLLVDWGWLFVWCWVGGGVRWFSEKLWREWFRGWWVAGGGGPKAGGVVILTGWFFASGFAFRTAG